MKRRRYPSQAGLISCLKGERPRREARAAAPSLDAHASGAMWARPGALAACVALAFAFGCAHARSPASLEDTLSHLEYARLFDAFHSWARRHHRTYPTAAKERSALAAFYLVRGAFQSCFASARARRAAAPTRAHARSRAQRARAHARAPAEPQGRGRVQR